MTDEEILRELEVAKGRYALAYGEKCPDSLLLQVLGEKASAEKVGKLKSRLQGLTSVDAGRAMELLVNGLPSKAPVAKESKAKATPKKKAKTKAKAKVAKSE